MEEVCLGPSNLEITGVVPRVRRQVAAVRVLSIGVVLSVCSGTFDGPRTWSLVHARIEFGEVQGPRRVRVAKRRRR